MDKGRLIGPLNPGDFPYAQISSLGAVEKKHSTKWRLILDLSHPAGFSVNDGIAKPQCSLTYSRVRDAVDQILRMGKGCYLAKIDIDSAFRNIPVHPHDRHLLGMIWSNALYIDTVLPFGLRSAPKIFNAIASGFQWIAKKRGVSFLDRFLDDFITGAASEADCARNLYLLENTCSILNLPLALHKKEGPATCLTYLGIELDTVAMEIRLPAQKLHRLKHTIQKWVSMKFCKRKQLESLIGLLHDASIVVRPGRTFIRRLIDALKSSNNQRRTVFIRLNKQAKSDIMWWHCFIEQWNGLSMMTDDRKSHPDICLMSDASGSWGCGAFVHSSWFQLKLPESFQGLHITIKELLPIVMAAAIWGEQWQNKSVLCRCDNLAAVHIINSGTSSDAHALALLRCLHFVTAKFNIILSAVHLPGVDNVLADALSRDNLAYFFLHNPQASPLPSLIPVPLMDLLASTNLDWTSPSWNSTFSSIFKRDCQRALSIPISQPTVDTPPSANNQEAADTPLRKTSCASSSVF